MVRHSNYLTDEFYNLNLFSEEILTKTIFCHPNYMTFAQSIYCSYHIYAIAVCPLNSSGVGCGSCDDGMFGDPFNNSSCQMCNCDINGSQNILCSNEGICNCKADVVGDKCRTCSTGLFPFPDCNTGNIETGAKNYTLAFYCYVYIARVLSLGLFLL